MKKITPLFIPLLLALIAGCSNSSTKELKEADNPPLSQNKNEMKKVTGIGGIFFKCKDPQKIKEWYNKNLGLKTDEYGSMFEFRKADEPDEKAYLQWSPFSEKTKYFEPSQKEFMINYRVENLEKLLEELKASGVEVVGELQSFEYGKFAHIMDPEGNKIELWEPVDSGFTKTDDGKTTK